MIRHSKKRLVSLSVKLDAKQRERRGGSLGIAKQLIAYNKIQTSAPYGYPFMRTNKRKEIRNRDLGRC